MNVRVVVLALGVLLAASPCVQAQNKGKQLAKGIEAALSKKVAKAPKGSRGPKVRTSRVKSSGPGITGTGIPKTAVSRRRSTRHAAGITRTKNLQPATIETSYIAEGMGFTPVQQFAVDYLEEQAQKERAKVFAASNAKAPQIIVDGYLPNGELYVEAPRPTQQDYDTYAKAVRNALQFTKTRVEGFGRGDGFYAYREKTYSSALELAEDVAVFSAVVPEIVVPPCFLERAGGKIGYIIEIPADGIMITTQDGVSRVLDPETEVIFYSPDSSAMHGKGALIIDRSSLENPSLYNWLSPRPVKKFAAEEPIPYGAGYSKDQWQKMNQALEDME